MIDLDFNNKSTFYSEQHFRACPTVDRYPRQVCGRKEKKMNTFSCCSPFWVSINRCIKTNDCNKCPLSKSPFPLSFSQSIKDSWLHTDNLGHGEHNQYSANNWHKLCHWQYSNSTFSPPVVHVPSPSPHGCVATHNVVYILSLYPLPYVSIIGWIDVVRYMIGPPLPSLSDNSVWPRI